MAIALDSWHRRSAGLRRLRLGARHLHASQVATGALAFALVFLMASDGSLVWRVIRTLYVALLALGALLATSARSAAVRGGAAFASGLVGIAVGVGIGLPHLAKAGPAATTAAGVSSLVSGVVLAGMGATTLVRPARRWWRLPLVPLLAFATVVVLFTLGQAVAATNVPRPSLDDRTPADAGVPYDDVRFTTGDDVELAGWYLPSANGAAVVVAHGAGSTRSGSLDQALVLARHGYGVLLYDARGHGQSDGRAMDFGWYGDEDVAAGISFLSTRAGVDPQRIAGLGMSMGGEEVIGAAATDARIRAVVAEGATNRTAADRGWLSEAYGVRGWLQEQVDRLTTRAVDLLTSADEPIALRDAIAAAAPRPVLLIAGGAVGAENHAGRYLKDAAPASVELWVAPGAGHTSGLATHPEEWEVRVTGFLDEALRVDDS